MTKVGEGKTPPEEPTSLRYHRALEASAEKFLNALESYRIADGEEKARLKAIMNQQLELIRASVNELKRAGIYKQEVKVENDFNTYMTNESAENLAALEHDLSTLRGYNELP